MLTEQGLVKVEVGLLLEVEEVGVGGEVVEAEVVEGEETVAVAQGNEFLL